MIVPLVSGLFHYGLSETGLIFMALIRMISLNFLSTLLNLLK